MAKFHITKSGETKVCTARARQCPLGGEEEHFDTVTEAAQESMRRSLARIESVEQEIAAVEALQAENKARLEELRGESVPHEEGITYEQALFISKTAPRSLRPFFEPENAKDEDGAPIFNARRAVLALSANELDATKLRKFKTSGDSQIAEDALMRLSTPDFIVDAKWERSMYRRVLADWMPETLQRLEDEAEEAWLHRQLATPPEEPAPASLLKVN